MPFYHLFLIQAVFGPPVPVERKWALPRSSPAACPTAASSEEITVCARRGPDQRLRPLPDLVEAARNPTAFRLPGGGSGSLAGAQSSVGGFTAPAVKATLRIPLGKGRRD